MYLGNGQTLKPDPDESPAECEQSAELLAALRKAVVELEQRPATSGRNERAYDHLRGRAEGSHLAGASRGDRKSISAPRIGPRGRVVRRGHPAGTEL